MYISIIIPSFKRSNLLKWNLISLAKQQIPFDHEVIVLNDGIKDETSTLCWQYRESLNLHYIFTGHRNDNGLIWRIPGYAINIGVKRSIGDVILLCCAEMFHINDSIKAIVDVYTQPNSDKIISIPHAKDDNGSFLRLIEKSNGSYTLDDYYNQPNLDNVKFPFFMAFKKKEFVDIGGYDEDFIGTDFDDSDFVRRLLQNGCDYKVSDAQVIHLWHARLPMSADRKVRYDYNKRLFDERAGIIIRNEEREWGVL